MLYWRSGTKIIPISDMTDEHIRNAINYINKQPNILSKDIRALEALREEQNNRERNRIIEATKIKCSFCEDGMMIMTEHAEEPDPEACTGFGGFTKYTHSLVCQKCGACGPEKQGKIECEHDWAYESLREPNFNVAIGKKRTCKICQVVEISSYTIGRLGSPWIKI